MEEGWIKLHRKIVHNPICQKTEYFAVWIMMLLKANHKPVRMIWNGNTIIIKEGQFITSRDALAKVTGCSPSMVERILKYLENEQQIEQHSTTKYRLITIVNWKEHQSSDSTSDSKRTATGQQLDTNKNDKNDKNDKNTADAGLVIDLFKEINPAFAVYFKRKPQREAAQRLFIAHGLERLTGIIGYIKANISQPYFPSITSPSELEEKWSKLEAFARRQKDELSKPKRTVIL